MNNFINRLHNEIIAAGKQLDKQSSISLPTPETMDTLIGNKEKTLIIGAGEIGKSLQQVLDRAYDVYIRDQEEDEGLNKNWFRVIHICYPYSERFIEITQKYIKQYRPELVIIHSTLKPGTTKQLGKGFVHSPVNGKHPNLAQSILTFIKFIGGNDIYDTFAAVAHLQKAGIKTQVFANSTTTELAKVQCTRRYGVSLVEMKESVRECEEFGVPFQEVYTEWNNAYNQGYAELGDQRFSRPVLYPLPGPIGGHCVIPNLELLADRPLSEFIKSRNETYKNEQGKSRRKNNNLSSRVK